MSASKLIRSMIFLWILTFSALTLSAWDWIFNAPTPAVAALRLTLALLIAAAVTGLGLWLSGQIGLGAPILARLGQAGNEGGRPRFWLEAAMVAGVAIGSLGLLAMKAVFLHGNQVWQGAWAAEGESPLWRRVALCYEAGVLEEILFRFVLLSLFVWAILAFRKTGRIRPAVFWPANGLAAVLFGIAHLSKPFPLSPAEAAGVLLINGLGALAFGYLFWKKGLESAILAHFSADFVVRIVGHLIV